MQAFPGIMTHWRKVTSYLMFLFFNCLCFSILYLIFSEAFSAAWWWKARRISSIINHLKEVGPTFFFAINIFVLTLCFACLFRRFFLCLGMKKQAGSYQHQEALEKGMDMYCFFSNDFYSLSLYHFRSVAFSEVFFVAPVIEDWHVTMIIIPAPEVLFKKGLSWYNSHCMYTAW